MVDYKRIGRRISAFRRRAGLTQESVAESVGITTVYLSKIENGHVRPTVDMLDAICSALGCGLDAIFADAPVLPDRQSERAAELFGACLPSVKPLALELLEGLSRLRP